MQMRYVSLSILGNPPQKMTQPFDQNSISYYEENSDVFISKTAGADLSDLYKVFLKNIPAGGRILDLGCGSGRDSKIFKKKYYEVVAVDASAKMVEATRRITNVDARVMRFDELRFVEEFDGIWACASLLHVPENQLPSVLEKCLQALRKTGGMYLSFKHGATQKVTGGRLFTDLNEEKFNKLVGEINCDLSVSTWVTVDVRPERRPQDWLNAIIKFS